MNRIADGLYEKLFTVVLYLDSKEVWTVDARSWYISERAPFAETMPVMREQLAQFLVCNGMDEKVALTFAASAVRRFEP